VVSKCVYFIDNNQYGASATVKNAYLTGSDRGLLEYCSGTGVTKVVFSEPSTSVALKTTGFNFAIGIDSSRNKLYWIGGGNTQPALYSCSIGSCSPGKVADVGDSTSQMRQIKVDEASGDVYLADGKTIWKVRGTSVTSFVTLDATTPGSSGGIFALEVLGPYVYYGEKAFVRRVSLSSGGNKVTVRDMSSECKGINSLLIEGGTVYAMVQAKSSTSGAVSTVSFPLNGGSLSAVYPSSLSSSTNSKGTYSLTTLPAVATKVPTAPPTVPQVPTTAPTPLSNLVLQWIWAGYGASNQFAGIVSYNPTTSTITPIYKGARYLSNDPDVWGPVKHVVSKCVYFIDNNQYGASATVKNAYLTGSDRGLLEYCSGTGVTKVVFSEPSTSVALKTTGFNFAIGIDSSRNKLYWIGGGNTQPALYSCSIGSCSPGKVADVGDSTSQMRQIKVDEASGDVYLADGKTIWKVRGTSVTSFVTLDATTPGSSGGIFALEVLGPYVYYGEKAFVRRVSLSSGGNKVTVRDMSSECKGINSLLIEGGTVYAMVQAKSSTSGAVSTVSFPLNGGSLSAVYPSSLSSSTNSKGTYSLTTLPAVATQAPTNSAAVPSPSPTRPPAPTPTNPAPTNPAPTSSPTRPTKPTLSKAPTSSKSSSPSKPSLSPTTKAYAPSLSPTIKVPSPPTTSPSADTKTTTKAPNMQPTMATIPPTSSKSPTSPSDSVSSSVRLLTSFQVGAVFLLSTFAHGLNLF